jgi:predicted flap endonuclease-1-like 5' DNA nuclease
LPPAPESKPENVTPPVVAQELVPPKSEPKVHAEPEATTAAPDKTAKYRLELTDLLERAPSIGPKTANRLLSNGWRTVGDFLAADPNEIARKLNSSWATIDIVSDWQKQAWLVLQIAELSGTGAQMLVGAGYPTVEEVAAADPGELLGYITEFAQSSAGQRVLRDGKVPDQVTAARWIAAARGGRRLSPQKKSA